MTYIIIGLIIGIIATAILAHKYIIRLVAEKRALPKIEKLLFKGKGQNRAQVLKEIHQLTNNRLNDELAMDYFYKIKGLQVVNINQPTNFWVKMYLTTPTKIKLNYFEQVKFYETFLNYPSLKNKKKPEDRKNLKTMESRPRSQFTGKLMPQKLA